MVTLEHAVERRADVALVELVVSNPSPVPKRVRVANRLDGPVQPPRRKGVPESGWDDGGFEGTVGAGESVALGYASSGTRDGPPAEIVWAERAASEPDGENCHADLPSKVESTPAGVVRALGDPTPPADAVALPEPEQPAEPTLPEAVATWLEPVEARVERCESLSDASGVAAAARVLEGEGGIEAAARLLARVEDDAGALRAVERRVRELRERAENADVPLDTFRRLA